MKKTLKIAANLLAATVVVGNMAACGVPSSFNSSDFVKSDGENLSKAKANLKGISMKIAYSKELVEEWNKQNGFEVKAINPNFYRIKVGLRHAVTGYKPSDQFSTPSSLSDKLFFSDLETGSWIVYIEAQDKAGVFMVSNTGTFNVVAGQETIANLSLVLPVSKGKITVGVSVS